VQVLLHGLHADQISSAQVLKAPVGADRYAANTVADQPVGLVPLDGVHLDQGNLQLTLPPLSWAVVTATASTV
jgi:alpha-N-arabinofuranosidase